MEIPILLVPIRIFGVQRLSGGHLAPLLDAGCVKSASFILGMALEEEHEPKRLKNPKGRKKLFFPSQTPLRNEKGRISLRPFSVLFAITEPRLHA
jgi:hypothetical protein